MKQSLFDAWSYNYNKDIIRLQHEYPFAGYFEIIKALKHIFKLKKLRSVLDIGIGSGFMLSKLIDTDMQYYGIDYSSKMLEIASSKFDKNKLIQHDITKGVPRQLENEYFDIILSAYTLHHFNDDMKMNIIKSFLKLSRRGLFIIADISFDNAKDMLYVKNKEGDGWDSQEEEGYFLLDEFKNKIQKNDLFISYKKISYCSGIYIIAEEQPLVL